MPTLPAMMRAAVALAMTIASVESSAAAVAPCAGAAQRLVTLIKHDWPSSDENTPAAVGDMIGLIARKSPKGFVGGATRLTLPSYSRQEFIRRAARLKPPFAPSRDLLTALDELTGNLSVVGLPGTSILAADSVDGTAHCHATVFFSTANRPAPLLHGPENLDDDRGSSCGVTRSLAAVDGVPLVIDDSLSFGPGMTSTLTLTPWIDGKWAGPCQAEFVFAPHFDTSITLNDWASLDNWEPNKCGSDCASLRRAAIELVRQTQSDPGGVQARLLAVMTVPQRDEYQRLKRIADRPDATELRADAEDAEKPITAVGLTDTSPLVLPMIVNNRVLVASVGHFTIGWRVFADWKVTVDAAADADKTTEIARFAIGMTQGPIISATVK